MSVWQCLTLPKSEVLKTGQEWGGDQGIKMKCEKYVFICKM